MAADPLIVVAGLFGLVVGSFLNVCIHRVPRHESIVTPRSRCTRCGHMIAWYENIPLASWIALGARCRGCGERISVMYPIVELTTGALFALTYWQCGLSPLLGVRLVFAAVLVVLFAIDLEHQILPNAITLPAVVLGLAASPLGPGWRASLIGIIVGGLIPFLIAEGYYRLRKQEGLGMGDVKMLAMIGAVLGWAPMLLTLVFASFAGAVVGLALIAAGRGNMQRALPFGTFLAVAALVAAYAGEPIITWYLGYW